MNNKSNIPPINWLEQNRTKRQMRTNPRNMKTNPRAKGTNPRAIEGNEMDTLSNKAILEKDNWNVIAKKLKSKNYLMSEKISLADIAIFPFIRQFSLVDEDWFLNSRYQELKKWLSGLIETQMFIDVMKKN